MRGYEEAGVHHEDTKATKGSVWSQPRMDANAREGGGEDGLTGRTVERSMCAVGLRKGFTTFMGILGLTYGIWVRYGMDVVL